MKEDIVIFDKQTGVAHIKKGVTVVPYSTILGNQRVKTLLIPEGVKEIRPFAFINLKNLTKVVFPSTLEKIGAFGFCTCGNVETELPDNLKELGVSALDFDNGIIKLNASNTSLVEEVGLSLRNHIYYAAAVDETLTFTKLKYQNKNSMTVQQAWSKLRHYNRARKKQPQEYDD